MPRLIFLAALIACALGAFAPGMPHHRTLAAPPRCSPARPHASGSSSGSITTPDGERTYLLHVPPSYNGAAAVPLVLGFHGLSGTSTAIEAGTQFSARADQTDGGFIVVYPQGLVATFPVTHFNNWQLPSPEPDDVAFVTQLLDTLESQLCIDVSRVYATGLSNGAMMSVRLACSLSSRIAAVGLVAGAYYPPQSDTINGTETCPDTGPVPVIAFHGTADTAIPFDGGGFLNARLPIDSTTGENVMGDWAAHNNCTSGRQESQIDTEVRLVQYDDCDNGASLELYIVDGGGHTWPGAADVPSLGYTTHQISATDLIWQSFQGHSLPPTATATPTLTPTQTPTSTPTVTPTPSGLVGDANKDGQVNPIDAAIVLQYSAGLISSINPNADANHDGRQNSIDAALILQYVAGLISQLPP